MDTQSIKLLRLLIDNNKAFKQNIVRSVTSGIFLYIFLLHCYDSTFPYEKCSFRCPVRLKIRKPDDFWTSKEPLKWIGGPKVLLKSLHLLGKFVLIVQHFVLLHSSRDGGLRGSCLSAEEAASGHNTRPGQIKSDRRWRDDGRKNKDKENDGATEGNCI